MTSWLLDTNVVSELRRPRPNHRVVEFVRRQPLDRLFVSAITLAELRFGIESLGEGQVRDDLTGWLNRQVRPMFERRILPVSEEVIFRWRTLVEQGRRAGHTFPQPDLFIAATALHHGLTVVTRDVAGFALTGVPLLDPWQNSSP